MNVETCLFEGPIMNYHRGWNGFLFGVTLNREGMRVCQPIFEKFPGIRKEIIIDLLKYLCGAGFMVGAEGIAVPYDESRIDHVVCSEDLVKQRGLILSDLTKLRNSNPVSVEDGLAAIQFFLGESADLLGEFTPEDNFWETYPFGIFRCESLLSMIGVQKMDIFGYLDRLSINLRERKVLFGNGFTLAHCATGIPFDHDQLRNIFSPLGIHSKIGEIKINGCKKDVFLRFSLGDGEGYMGMSLAICLENPESAFFKVAYQMIRDEGGEVFPQIVVIQASPMQIDKRLNFVKGYLPHEEFPSGKTVLDVQAKISTLLGGGDVFNTLIMTLMTYYQARGSSDFSGIRGIDNNWLIFHEDSVVERKEGASETVTRRASKIYCERFSEMFGFRRVNGHWQGGLSPECYCRSLSKVIFPRASKKRKKAISVVSERGLAMVFEKMQQLLGGAIPGVIGADIFPLMADVFRNSSAEGKRIESLYAARN